MQPDGAPHLYTIAAGAPFVDALADGLLERHGADPLVLATATILLPTRRACRALREAFLRRADGRPLLLPAIRPLGDVDEEELGLTGAAALDLKPALPPMRRQLHLARLLGALPDLGALAQRVELAGELAAFLDELLIEEVPLDRLDTLAPEEFAAHWQRTLTFLDILRRAWPAHLAEHGAMEAAERRRALTDALVAHWQTAPPAGPVYAAGSTGSIPATARLLRTVAHLPQGAVILPGFDLGLDATQRRLAHDEASHPQHGMLRLLEAIGADATDVRLWPHAEAGPRVALLRQALLPAAATADWPTLPAPDAKAREDLHIVDVPTQRDEALAIALLLREALERPGHTAALVTPDRKLARRVAAELKRWSIDIDDTAGLPLADTPPGAFVRLLARAALPGATPHDWLALAQHRLARGGWRYRDFLRHVRHLDERVLRGVPFHNGLDDVRPDERASPDFAAWLTTFKDMLAPLRTALADGEAAATDLIALLFDVAERMADGDERLYRDEAGEALAVFAADALDAAPALGTMDPADLPDLIDALMAGTNVRRQWGRHPRLAIYGLLEARLVRADRVVLAGLNDGTWPPKAETDAFLSRDMRTKLGLPPPERRIGLTAHDFVQAAAGGEVFLTRALKVDGTPTVAARWLLRLDALLGPAAARALRDHPVARWARHLDDPGAYRPGARPEPKPPAEARPTALYVTRIEQLIRDPYAVYARDILRLYRLDDIWVAMDARERGDSIHKALEAFVAARMAATADTLDEAATAGLLAALEQQFRATLDDPVKALFWRPHLQRLATWFVADERDRRSQGDRPLALEARGQIVMADGLRRAFTLSAKADRIDRMADGTLAVIDYKSGRPPGRKEVEIGLSPQLTLEAAIAARGGFLPAVPAAPAGALIYLRTSGRDEGGERVELSFGDRKQAVPIPEIVERHHDALLTLLARYEDADMPYLPRPRLKFSRYEGDYGQLSRFKEWSAITGADE